MTRATINIIVQRFALGSCSGHDGLVVKVVLEEGVALVIGDSVGNEGVDVMSGEGVGVNEGEGCGSGTS